jgi:hypothetical protein
VCLYRGTSVAGRKGSEGFANLPVSDNLVNI